jgi:SAM-dependent methyltransferase
MLPHASGDRKPARFLCWRIAPGTLSPMAPDVPLGPHARALAAYHAGRTNAVLELRTDQGEEDEEFPVEVFFRTELFPFEEAALDLCRGRILDLGAAVGVHSLILQERGFDVTSVEIVPEAAEIARERGVRDVRTGDFLEMHLDPANTVLLLMNGPGPCGTLEGFDRLMIRLHDIVLPGGQVIFDSGPPRVSEDSRALPGTIPARELGRYPGEAWVQLSFDGEEGAPFRELYIDRDTARTHAEAAGWSFAIAYEGESGTYTAKLTRAGE